MNNTETARLAREWADTRNPDTLTDLARAAREHILATTTEPTMADIGWDDEEHRLAGATTPEGTEVVMMWHDADETNQIICLNSAWEPDRLTPNGKKYELREVTPSMDEPTHPATLTTLEDYINAPAGTVIAEPGGLAWTKRSSGGWTADSIWLPNPDVADKERQVLRWRWGK